MELTQEDLLAALKKANENIETLDAKNRELALRMLEVEQKGIRNPSSAIGDASAGNEMKAAFEKSDAFRLLQKDEVKQCRIQIPSTALQIKATIGSQVSGGYISQADRRPGIVPLASQRLRMRELLPAIPTEAGSTEYLRTLTETLAALPQGGTESPTVFGGEGATKSASDMTLQLVNSPVVTIATTFTCARQALSDSDSLLNLLSTRGIYGYELELENEILVGTGASGKLNGLVNQASAFTGGATNQTRADTIRKAITQLALANFLATAVVLHPSDAEALELAKDSQNRYMGVVLFIDGQPTIWRINIIESNSMNIGTFLCGAFAQAGVIRDRQLATVEVSLDHSDYRTRNLALILIEGRVGLEVHQPGAMITGSLNYSG